MMVAIATKGNIQLSCGRQALACLLPPVLVLPVQYVLLGCLGQIVPGATLGGVDPVVIVQWVSTQS